MIVVGDDLSPAHLETASQMRVLAAILPGQVLLPVLACEPRAEAFAAEMTGDHVNAL